MLLHGPGKYDNLCTFIREQTQAEVVFLAVVNGVNGTGFSIQMTGGHRLSVALAAGLRAVADQIEKDILAEQPAETTDAHGLWLTCPKCRHQWWYTHKKKRRDNQACPLCGSHGQNSQAQPGT